MLRFLVRDARFGENTISLKWATLKLAFLLTLASGKRGSKLHALSQEVRLVEGKWEKIVLNPVSSFVSKTKITTHGKSAFQNSF